MANVKISQLPDVLTVQSNDLTIVSEPDGLGGYKSKKMTIAQEVLFTTKINTKGDLLTYSTQNARLAIGSNYSLFRANSASATGNEWGPVLTPLSVGFSLADGTSVKTLTVTEDCVINQNLSTTSDALFNSISGVDNLTIYKNWDANGFVAPINHRGATSPNKQFYLGYDTVNDEGVIQAVEQFVSVRPIKLNPAGGQVSVNFGSGIPAQSIFDVNGDIFSSAISTPSTPVGGAKIYGKTVSGTTSMYTLDSAGVESLVGAQNYWQLNSGVLSPADNTNSLEFGPNVAPSLGATVVVNPTIGNQFASIFVAPGDGSNGASIVTTNETALPLGQVTFLSHNSAIGGGGVQSLDVMLGVQIPTYINPVGGNVGVGGDFLSPGSPAEAQLHVFSDSAKGMIVGGNFNKANQLWLGYNSDIGGGDLQSYSDAGSAVSGDMYVNRDGGNLSVGPISSASSILSVHGATSIDDGLDPSKRIEIDYDGINFRGRIRSNYGLFETDLVLNPNFGNAVGINIPDGQGLVSVLDLGIYGDLRVGEITTPPTNFTVGQKIYGKSDGNLYCMNAAGTETNLTAGGGGGGYWATSSSFLTPVTPGTYNGIKLTNIANTQTLGISYETNGIYYNSTDVNAIHRFWQTLQAETKVKLNNFNDLTADKGISLYGGSDDYKLGYDFDGVSTSYYRFNIDGQDAGHVFGFSAGLITDPRNFVFTINGLGQVNAITDQSNGFIINGKTDTTKKMTLGFDVTNNKSFIESQSGTGPITYRNLMLLPGGGGTSNVAIGHPLAYTPQAKLDVNGNIRNNAFISSSFDATTAGQLRLFNAGETGLLLAGFVNATSTGLIRAATGDGTTDLDLSIEAATLTLDATVVSTISGQIDSGGLKFDNITEFTPAAGITLRNNTTVFKDDPNIVLRGSTNTTKFASLDFSTSSNSLTIRTLNVGDQFYPITFEAQSLTFNMGTGTIATYGSINAFGLNFNTINEYTANNGVRVNSKLVVGGVSAPVAVFNGFGSTFLGVSENPFASSTMVANQLQIWADEGGSALKFVYKYNNGATVKTGTLAIA